MPDPATRRPTRPERLHRALAEGVRLYNGGRFFECHEVLEEVWLQESGEDKAFLQGLIKVAAAFHHYGQGTYEGMLSLLQAGAETLRPFAPARHGVELGDFLGRVEAWIPRARRLLASEPVEDGAALPPLVYRPEG